MKKFFLSGAYTAPSLKALTVRCEEGFATSTTIEGITSEDGAWDE